MDEVKQEALQMAKEAAREVSGASFSRNLWSGKLRLAVHPEDLDEDISEEQASNGKLKIDAEAFAKAERKGPKAQAQYLANFINGLADGKVPADAPKRCLMTNVVDKLDPPQLVPSLLISPGSPLTRLVVVQPPGAGKTCIMLEILSNFLSEDYNILIVGDPDIFSSVKQNLRKCPAREPGGNFLRDRNPGQAEWCALKSRAKESLMDPKNRPPSNCGKNARVFEKARIYWLSYVLFGNWIGGLAKYGSPDLKLFGGKRNTLILMDEVHKLTAPTEDPDQSWRRSLFSVGEFLAKEPKEASSTKTYVVGFTATPILDDPVQAICLATVFKGRTDPNIFVSNDPRKELRINPKTFYRDCVEEVTSIKIREPGSTFTHLMKTEEVAKRLRENNCLQVATSAKSTGEVAKRSVSHPCPVSYESRASNLYKVYSLKPEAKENLKILFSNLFFVTNNSMDPRKYPKLVSRTRLVEYPRRKEGKAAFADLAKDAFRKHPNGLSWQEVSNFADQEELKRLVRRWLAGNSPSHEELLTVERNAPKWKSLAQDLAGRDDFAGKTAVYLGARTVSGAANSTEYLFGLSFYLQGRLGYRDGTSSQVLERKLRQGGPSRSRAVYIIADPDTKSTVATGKTSGSDEKLDALNMLLRPKNPEDRMIAIRNVRNRELQLKLFNQEPCVGNLQGARRGSDYSIVLLGYEAYKALDLRCTSNLARMVLQPDGKKEQTVGRAHRSCSFGNVKETDLWRVNSVTYVFESPSCPARDCDCLLGSFLEAQARLPEQILSVLRGASIGCSNFSAYNQWPSGTVCTLDRDAPLHKTPQEKIRNFYFCSYSGAWDYNPRKDESGAQPALRRPSTPFERLRTRSTSEEGRTEPSPKTKERQRSKSLEKILDGFIEKRVQSPRSYRPAPIRPGVSGDVDPKLVLETCNGHCSDRVEAEETSERAPVPQRRRQRSFTAPLSEDIAREKHKVNKQKPEDSPKPEPDRSSLKLTPKLRRLFRRLLRRKTSVSNT